MEQNDEPEPKRYPCECCGEPTAKVCAGCWAHVCERCDATVRHVCPDSWGEERIG